MSPAALSSRVTAEVEPETVLIDLTVTDTSPTAAREIANGMAIEFSDFVDELLLKKSTSVPKPQVTIIAPAATPTSAVSPNTSRNVGLGLAAGVAVGLLIANLRERSNNSIRKTRQLDDIVGEPNLGRITASSAAVSGPVDLLSRDVCAIEGFKEIRTNLLHAVGSGRPQLVCVTSAGIGEGKTTVALGVASALTAARHTVVVVDADLRRGDLSATLGLADSPGLTDLIEQRCDVDDAIHRSGFHGLDVVPAGRESSRQTELLASGAATTAYARLGDRYDFVVLDTPAMLAFTDAAVVASCSDGVLLAARYATVQADDVETAVASLRLVDARVLGSILTFAPTSRPRRLGAKFRRTEGKDPANTSLWWRRDRTTPTPPEEANHRGEEHLEVREDVRK